MQIFYKIVKFFRRPRDPRNPNEQVKKILSKFRNGAAIESQDELRVLDRYASTGMVRFGFNYKRRVPEASLTDQGKWFLKQL